MNEEEIHRLADEISFRLMATNKHEDQQWLIEVLTKAFKQNKNEDSSNRT